MSRDSFLGYRLERGCTVSVGIKNSILGPTLPLIQEKYTMKVVPFSLGFLCIIWVAVPVFSDSSAYQYYQYDYNQVDENQVGGIRKIEYRYYKTAFDIGGNWMW